MVLGVSKERGQTVRRWKLFLCVAEWQVETVLLLRAMLEEHSMMMWPSLDLAVVKLLARLFRTIFQMSRPGSFNPNGT